MEASQLPIRLKDRLKKASLPLANEYVAAGFPSPAEDYIDNGIDLNEHLIRNPSSTFFLKVKGDSMINAGIESGDLLVVDRSINPQPGCVVVAMLDGAFTLKKLVFQKETLYLEAENPNYPSINLNNYDNVHIWGVAIYAIHKLSRIAKSF
ncbi:MULTISPECIES: LexA family protein [Prochlorococcus]|uniref:LexA family protein n=1 Tax=Prochlorococcus TaxID=1218 RepID=UPI000533813F|nr:MULTISPECIES: translesion error-prone DNA polymerase V autoproteolytic subunit [Prochlorococcus]KGG12629.1 Error-prone repair protein UmuD [Prochlorococcus sp. MIT 0601]